MAEIREEWFKLVLNELRKNNDKVDEIRADNFKKIEELENQLTNRLNKSENQHRELLLAQEKMVTETGKLTEQHYRMNELLQEHMRRTVALEQIVEIMKEQHEMTKRSINPLVEEYQEKQIIAKHTTVIEEKTNKKLRKKIMIIGGISTLLGAIATAMKLLDFF